MNRTFAAAALALALLPAAAAAQTQSSPDAALARYRAALDALPLLGNMVFRYSENRSGPTRVLEEEHRVYRRADGEERNETVMVNGAQVVPAIVRYLHKPVWPYDVRQFAVDGGSYNIVSLGRTVVAGKRVVGFSTVRATTGDFAITALYLDPTRYLPLRETFAVAGGGCSGNGSIDFAPFGSAWLPTAVSVNCSVAQDATSFKESIVFADYAFVAVLPPDVFGGAQ
jgi:hypothetical protein